jgi:ferredoxin
MKININHELCTNPRECRLCLDRCQEKVFGIYPEGKRAVGVRAQHWVIAPVFSNQCTGCQDCLSFCPPGAISLS